VTRGARVALLCLAAALSAGCSKWLLITGPKWSERSEPDLRRFEFVDHSESDSLRLLVFGDSGTGGEAQYRVGASMVEACQAAGGCDLALMAGDKIYPAGVRSARRPEGGRGFDPVWIERFEQPYAGLGRMDFWAVPGNHDWYRRGSVDAQVAYSAISPRFRMPAHDYRVPGLPQWIGIYGLDTAALEAGRETGQIDRARDALCDRDGWKVLFGHHPAYSSGRHTNRHGEEPRIRDAVLPLIEECDVRLFVAGHDHHQEHLSTPSFEQVVQGAAAKLRKVRSIDRLPQGVEQQAGASRLGFAIVVVSPERLEVRFYGEIDDGGSEPFHCFRLEPDRSATLACHGSPSPSGQSTLDR